MLFTTFFNKVTDKITARFLITQNFKRKNVKKVMRSLYLLLKNFHKKKQITDLTKIYRIKLSYINS